MYLYVGDGLVTWCPVEAVGFLADESGSVSAAEALLPLPLPRNGVAAKLVGIRAGLLGKRTEDWSTCLQTLNTFQPLCLVDSFSPALPKDH